MGVGMRAQGRQQVTAPTGLTSRDAAQRDGSSSISLRPVPPSRPGEVPPKAIGQPQSVEPRPVEVPATKAREEFG
jgi:hypothetical protein